MEKIDKKINAFFMKFLVKSEDIDYYMKSELKPANEALKLTLLYGTISLVWIFLSDEVVSLLVKRVDVYKELAIYKGWVFIFVSMVILFFTVFKKEYLFKLAIDKILNNYEKINNSNEQLIALEEKLRQQFVEVRKHRDALIESENRYKLAIEGADCGIWEYNPLNGDLFYSPKWKKILGFDESEVKNSIQSWENLLHPEDKENAFDTIRTYLKSKNGAYENSYRMRTKSGEYRYVLSKANAIRDEEGRVLKVAGSHTDITHQRNIEDNLNTLAYYDKLTGLPNNFSFEDRADKLIKANKPFSLLYIDVDNFKHINETLGHSYGNILLRFISDILRREIDSPHFVSRFSGDEFAIILENMTNQQEIINKVENILFSIRKNWTIEGQQFFITISIGIAIFPYDGGSTLSMLQNADVAMYSIKKNSKDGYRFYSKEIYQKHTKRIRMVNDLRRAIQKQEFVLHYQPIIDIISGELVGVEALIRWEDPKNGLISPMEFIPLAEEKGLIYDIEKWALRAAVIQKKSWEEMGYKKIKMSVNLSGKRICNDNIIQEVKQLIEETNIRSDELQLEVTETAVMQDIDAAMKILSEIKDIGVKIALDDFGTGYSSLTYLKKLPIDIVKLDRDFIRNISKIGENEFIVEHIIKLTHELKLRLVAEGIETKEQLIFLKRNRCDFGQGYLFSKPLTKEKLEEMFFINP